MLGIDISFAQTTNIDFNALRESGVEFVFCKATGSNTGDRYVDSKYNYFRPLIRDAGLALGHYHFNGLLQPAGDAQFHVANTEWQDGDVEILDCESEGSMPAWTSDQAYEYHSTVLSERGVVPITYGSSSLFGDSWENVHGLGSKLWVAQYGTNSGAQESEPSGVGPWGDDWTIWQYTSNANLNGYDGRLDANLSRVDVRTIHGGATPAAPTTTRIGDDNMWLIWNVTPGTNNPQDAFLFTPNGRVHVKTESDYDLLFRFITSDQTRTPYANSPAVTSFTSVAKLGTPHQFTEGELQIITQYLIDAKNNVG